MTRENGSALVAALVCSLLLTALGMCLVLASNVDTTIAANARNGQEALYAADAAIERALVDLAAMPNWNAVLAPGPVAECSAVLSTFDTAGCSSAAQLVVALPDSGQTVDLKGVTDALQAQIDNQNGWGANDPQWRLYGFGRLDDLLPGRAIMSRMYVAVWVADDVSETDGNPGADTNGILTLHAEAFGPSGTRRRVETVIARTPSSAVRVLSWHELR
jgi:hypothetical protein